MTATDTHRAIEAVWRIESARLIAGLVRMVRDIALAEDMAQDALVAALEKWPETSIPDNPGAWLMAAAKNRAIDRLRRESKLEEKVRRLGREIEAETEAQMQDPDDVGDDLLRLIFTACHPVLPTESQIALTLRLIAGLSTDEIARAFLVPASTVSQRILRAKKALAEAGAPFEVPTGAELAPRLSAVLSVVYLIFNEGYSATSGDRWIRRDLCEDALRLSRIIAGLAPGEPEVHGLTALLELQASRLRARVGPSGDPVLLTDQDRGRWDYVLIGRGLAALERVRQLGGEQGPYALQAAIAACHARAPSAGETDWNEIARLYEKLAAVAPSPVVELNRAVAVGMAAGPQAGLDLADGLAAEPALRDYHLLPGVRAELLARLGRLEEASDQYRDAASKTQNARQRRLLLLRAESPGQAGLRPSPK